MEQELKDGASGRGRAWRRAQVDRIKKKRKGYWWTFEPKTPREIGMIESAPKRCSDPYCCGNARYFYGPTMQERSFFQRLLNQ